MAGNTNNQNPVEPLSPPLAATLNKKSPTESYRDCEARLLPVANRKLQELRSQIPILDKLCREKNIFTITSLNDLIALKISHSTFKMYPEAFLEQKNFTAMNKWLDQVHTVKCSHIDVRDCQNLNQWLNRLDNHGIHVWHSSGTTGKPSFMIKSDTEMNSVVTSIANAAHADNAANYSCKVPVFSFGFQTGYSMFVRVMNTLSATFADPLHSYFMFPTLQDPDQLRAQGVMRRKIAAGQATPEEIQASQDAVTKQQTMMGPLLQKYITTMQHYAGKEVVILSAPVLMYSTAMIGLKAGITHLFAPGSSMICGGGLKGATLPDNWLALWEEFSGIPRSHIANLYGMTECDAFMSYCPQVEPFTFHYHLPPSLLPFLTDESGEHILPSRGIQTGRYGFFDPIATTYWPVIITSDKVTIDWDRCPACGASIPTIINITRFTSQDDDKLSCAAAVQSYVEGGATQS